MAVVTAPRSFPAEIVSTLRDAGVAIQPTERWTDRWSLADTTDAPNVYGLYARSIPLTKWLDRGVRDLLDHYPGEVGSGSLPPGLSAFTVPDSFEPGLGSWVLLYAGLSESATPRIVQYFGRGPHFTREPGGQSFHLSLGLFLAGASDPRVAVSPRARTLENVMRGSLSLTLEQRMRDMRLSYVQVVTPPCGSAGVGEEKHLNCGCMYGCERALLRDPATNPPPAAGWPTGARPLLNAQW